MTSGKLLMKHTHTIILILSDDSLRHLGPGEKDENTTHGTKSKSTGRTSIKYTLTVRGNHTVLADSDNLAFLFQLFTIVIFILDQM